MTNVPKPNLEQGNYICYADEPDTIVDNSGGGGGGGVVYLLAERNEETHVLVPKFTFNQVNNAFESGKFAIIKVIGDIETDFLYVVTIEAFEDEGESSYTVTARMGAGEISFVSTNPDELMTVSA